MRRVLALFAGVAVVMTLAVPAWAENARKSTDQPISVMAHGWHRDGWHHGDRDDYWRHRHHHRYDYDDYYYRHHRYDYDDYYYYGDYYYDCSYYRHHYYRHHDCY